MMTGHDNAFDVSLTIISSCLADNFQWIRVILSPGLYSLT